MPPKSSGDIIELFCGASGFGLGAELAGFRLTVAADVDAVLTASHELNFPRSKLLLLDLKATSGSSLVKEAGGAKITGVIGGPPCQGFSEMGYRDGSDPRNELVESFFRIVAEIRPLFFVLENVPGILARNRRYRLDNALALLPPRYTVLGPLELNAADFGAATRRRRVIVIGFDSRYVDEIREADFVPVRGRTATVADAIRDLPDPTLSKADAFGHYWGFISGARDRISPYAEMLRERPPMRLGVDWAKEQLSARRVSGLKPTAHTADVIRRYSAVQPGKRDGASRAPRLMWDSQCATLRAGTGPDTGSYQALRPIHPEEPRAITVREAARLQGFPDWFQFHPTVWHSFRMIGNSVSPIFARQVLKTIAKKL